MVYITSGIQAHRSQACLRSMLKTLIPSQSAKSHHQNMPLKPSVWIGSMATAVAIGLLMMATMKQVKQKDACYHSSSLR